MSYSIRTEEANTDWVRRFILFHQKRHPKEMGAAEVEAFLSYLAVERKVSSSTQNQAKAALLFLYKQVLNVELPWLDDITSAKPCRDYQAGDPPCAASFLCDPPAASGL